MMYNYYDAMKEDVKAAIENDYDVNDFDSRDDLEEKLNDDLWIDDSVTGNGSGSYTFSRQLAKEYIDGNEDLLVDALKEFCVDAETIAEKFINQDYEYFDVTIRCYLLGQIICEVLDETNIFD